jgi:hypothetical protein
MLAEDDNLVKVYYKSLVGNDDKLINVEKICLKGRINKDDKHEVDCSCDSDFTKIESWSSYLGEISIAVAIHAASFFKENTGGYVKKDIIEEYFRLLKHQ